MARLLPLSVVLLFSISGYAQRGGAMHGYRGAAGSVGFRAAPRPFAGFNGAPVRGSFAGPNFLAGRPRPAAAPQRHGVFTFGHINGGPFFTTPGFNHRFDGSRFHHHRFIYAYPYYYGYWAPYYDPFWEPYASGSYSNNANEDTGAFASIASQISDVDRQLEDLRDENESLRSELSRNQQQNTNPAPTSVAKEEEPTTVVIFKDGRRLEVKNYAIVGQTFWMWSDNRATKVPLSDLDLQQTENANAQRGLTFSVPEH